MDCIIDRTKMEILALDFGVSPQVTPNLSDTNNRQA